ncbi:metal ABC transporter substrate-binding protein [Chloroflexota bacterium]
MGKETIVVKKSKVFIIAILVLSLVIVSVLGGCTLTETSQLKVVTTTSLLASVVGRIGGDMVDVVNIIPPAQCPGHFDVKPGDIQKLANAGLFLMHGWQGEKFSQDLIDTANNPDLTVVQIDDESVKVDENTNWMTPPVQQAAIDKITTALYEVDVENSAAYQQSAAELKAQVETKEAEIRTKLAREDLVSLNVMCSDQLLGFIQWVGLNIVAEFGRLDLLTPQVVKKLVDEGREENVTLIIDNLQSGQDVGVGIAEELGCKRIILSNFPGGFDNTETWEKTIDRNIELILEAIAR